MGIFSSIKSAIFGRAKTAPAPAAAPTRAPSPAPAGQSFSAEAASAASMIPGVAPASPAEPVDVEAVLADMDAKKGQDLNWRSSIVDLMKLLGIDSSLSNRKELAQELGYTGALDGSAEMNIWLHKATMRELARNGGKVPTSLTD